MTRIRMAVLAGLASLGFLSGCLCCPRPTSFDCCPTSCCGMPGNGGPLLEDPGKFQPIPPNVQPIPPNGGLPPVGMQPPQAPLPPLQRLVPEAQATPLPAGPTARIR